jgi:hypothetical protein
MLLWGEIILIPVAKICGTHGVGTLYIVEDLWSEWEGVTCFPCFGQSD